MIERDLYVVRHGETDHNAKGIVQGRGVNLPLNEKGRAQAQAFYEAYKHVPFEIIYTSTLQRAIQTAAPFINRGIPFESLPELDEISWGDLEGQMNTLESDAAFLNLLKTWRAGDIHAKPSPSGESPYELQLRQKKFLEKLLATKYKTVLIATHGRFIRAFMCTLTGKPLSDMELFPHSNLCLYKLHMGADGSCEIDLHCEMDHLSAI